jgi:hypothetical protein
MGHFHLRTGDHMLQRLVEKFRPWMEAMAELDDPRGEHLLMLERRIRRLECKVGLLQECDETGATPTLAPTTGAPVTLEPISPAGTR